MVDGAKVPWREYLGLAPNLSTPPTPPVEPSSAPDSWISVAERLPDDDTLVLLALSDEEVWPGVRDGDVWRYADATPIESAQVTDWMDLPAAPKRRAA
jgi:hypothetical protein